MVERARSAWGLVLAAVWVLSALSGCDQPSSTPAAAQAPSVTLAERAAVDSDPEAFGKLKGELGQIIDDASSRYHPIVYHYDEDLLAKMDGVVAHLQGDAKPAAGAEAVRHFPEIDAKEEDDHFRETIRRWSEKTGKDLRAAIDGLKRDLAAVDKSKPFHPEFHKAFSVVFDDFIAIEVAEIRERRNRVIHARTRELLDPYRSSRPKIVAYFEGTIAGPPYQEPPAPAARVEGVNPR